MAKAHSNIKNSFLSGNMPGASCRALPNCESSFSESFTLLIQHLPCGVAVYEAVDQGDDFIIVNLNPSAEEIEGVRFENVVGKKLTQVFPGVGDFGLLDVLRRVWRTGESESHPVTLYLDEKINGWRKNHVFRLSSGEVVTVYEDCSVEKQRESELRENEERSQYIVENANEGILEVDPEMMITFVNARMAEMLGYVPVELLGRSYLDFQPESIKGDYLVHFEMRRKGQKEHYETLLLHKNGAQIPFAVSASPRLNETGEFCGSFAMYTDLTERKEIEKNLALLNERYDLAVRAAHLGVWDWDIRRNVLVWDDGMYALYGLKREDFAEAYEAWLSALHPDDVTKCMRVSEEARRGEREYDTEFRIILPGGEVRCIKAHGQVIRDAAGAPVRMTGVNYDVSGQRRAEKALRLSEEKFKKAFTTSPDAISITRQDNGIFVSINPGFTKIMGYEESELAGKSSLDVQMWVDPDARREVVRLLQEHGVVNGFESRFQTRSGEIRYGLISCAIIDLDGVAHILNTARDITPQKEAEEALRASEQRYRLLFQTIESGFALHEIILDDENRPVDYRFLEVNPAFERLTEMKAEDLIGHTVLEVMPNTEPVWIERYGRVALTGEQTHFENYSQELGKYYEVIAYSPAPRQFAVIFHDVTERCKMAEHLLQTQKLASIGTLAAGVAHEINSPLQVIVGSSGILMDRLKEGRADPDKTLHRLETINQNAWRIAQIVRSLLDYSRSTEDILSLADLNELVKKALQLTAHQARSMHNIEIRTNLDEKLPLFSCNANKIIQVLINLISNASDAMPGGGTITICTKLEEKDKHLVLEISDTGQGIEPEVASRIFDPFFTTKPVGQGTGLGLSIVMGIIRSHNGEIRVDSQPGEGATFRMYFPI